MVICFSVAVAFCIFIGGFKVVVFCISIGVFEKVVLSGFVGSIWLEESASNAQSPRFAHSA